MATYVITYDLRAPGRNYDDLIGHLKSYGTWARPTESTWVIVTDDSAVQVRDAAKQYIDSNDKLFVVESGGVGAWKSLPQSTTDWLRKYL